MAKAHKMTPKRRAALRKAQLASARKRKGHGKSSSKTTVKRRRKPSIKRQIASKAGYTARNLAIGAAVVYGTGLGITIGTNYAISRGGPTFQQYGKMGGTEYRQSGHHRMQFYGAGMSHEKKVRGFKRHVHGYLKTKAGKMDMYEMRVRHNNIMAYGNPHGPMGPIKSERVNFRADARKMDRVKALPAGTGRRRRRR